MKQITRRTAAAVIGAALVAVQPWPVVAAPAPDLGCQSTTSAIDAMRADLVTPPYFSVDNPVKQGGEFDPNRYFDAFSALRMRPGYTLGYIYHQDGMGGYPILYARPVDRPPYPDEAAYRAAGDHPSYLSFVEPQETPRGYFEYAAFETLAGQFYLDWHANYNDWRIVCGPEDIDAIIASLGTVESPGRPMDADQRRAAREIPDVAPTVILGTDTATVRMVVFTKWGGFVRRDLTITRPGHAIADESDRPLVPYECGIFF